MWIKVLAFLFIASPVFAETLIEGWEMDPWRLRLFEVKPDQAESSLDSPNALSGKNCLKVRYVFDNRGVDGKKVLAEAAVVTSQFAEPLDLSSARGVTVCVKGKPPALNLWVEDSDGDAYQFPVAAGIAEGWVRIFIPFESQEILFRPWGNGRWDGWQRVKSLSFEVTDVPETKYRNDPKGEVLYLDDLSVVER